MVTTKPKQFLFLKVRTELVNKLSDLEVGGENNYGSIILSKWKLITVKQYLCS